MMYDEKLLSAALGRMAKVAKHYIGNRILLFYLTKSGYTQSRVVEEALSASGIEFTPFLLTEVEPEEIGENGYKKFSGIVIPSNNGTYKPVSSPEIKHLGIPYGLGWDDIANLHRHVAGSLLFLAENKHRLGLQSFMLGLHKDLFDPPLSTMSVEPYSDRIIFGDRSQLLARINQLAPQRFQTLQHKLDDLLVNVILPEHDEEKSNRGLYEVSIHNIHPKRSLESRRISIA